MNTQLNTISNYNLIPRSVAFFLFTFLLFPFISKSQTALLKSTTDCAVWWAGSTYKIQQNQSVPVNKGRVVLHSAKNETESFQIILSPAKDMENVSVEITDFADKNENTISAENITIRKVEYVHVTKPSGRLHKAGWYPDPLPLCEAPFGVTKNKNVPVWITIKIPKAAVAGGYKASMKIKSEDWSASFPVELNVWDFSLPDLPFMRSGFGMSTSDIKKYHNLETNEELEQVTDMYFRSFKDYRISPYHFDALAPIKRNVKGIICSGGVFDPENSFSGKYSYKLEANRQGVFTDMVAVDASHPYLLKWQAKANPESQ